MIQNIRNEFTLDKRCGKVYAKRILEDEYDLPSAFKMIDEAFSHLQQMEEYIENFDILLKSALDKAKEEDKASEKVLKRLEEQWRAKLNIDIEIEMPKLKREIFQYKSLAEKLNYPIPVLE